MKRGLDWYKREPVAFIDGVQGLGPDLIGAYSVLLDLCYARAGETPRDDRHLAGILGCSVRKARCLTDALIERGKIEVDGAFIVNSRAKSEAKPRRELSETRANAGRKGGERSGQARRNKHLAEASASSKTEAEQEKEKEKKANGEGSATSARDAADPPPPPPAPPPSPPPRGDLDDLCDRVIRAVGVDPASDAARQWRSPSTVFELLQWRNLGLRDDEIVAKVASMTKGATSPPRTAKYFEAGMRELAEFKPTARQRPHEISHPPCRAQGSPVGFKAIAGVMR